MTTLSPRTEEALRQMFKRLNPWMVLLWRLGLGPWFDILWKLHGRIMVIAHAGRKTGLRRYVPVSYAVEDGELYCMAGLGPAADWYRNLMANPNVEVWLPDGWWAGVAEDISECERRLPLLRQVLIGTGRVTYWAGVDPIGMSDAEFDAATKKYCLLHIRRTEARTGRGGPGDLAWVWPLATMMLLPLALFRRKRRG
jgi:deazaflavin-dependent oxidoreductase (nitroreductase family)